MGSCAISGDPHQSSSFKVLEVMMGAFTMYIYCFDPYLTQFTTHAKPSFRTTDQLFGWLANLPTGPQWQATPINLNRYEPVRDVRLIWRDGLDVVKDLFSNLIFANYMTYDPHKVMRGVTILRFRSYFTGYRFIDFLSFIREYAHGRYALNGHLRITCHRTAYSYISVPVSHVFLPVLL